MLSETSSTVMIDSFPDNTPTIRTPSMLTPSESTTGTPEKPLLPNPLDALAEADQFFDDAAFLKDFEGYWEHVAPKLQNLLLSYLNGAFQVMGIDLNSVSAGVTLPRTNHLPRHAKVMERFLSVLEKDDIVHQTEGMITRGAAMLPSKSSSVSIYDEIITSYPAFEVDARMMAVTGPLLGECLTGKVDPLSLMFKNKASSKVLEDFYLHSPVFSTLTEHMISVLGNLFAAMDHSPDHPLRICEVGAGLGGTTARLVEFIRAMDVPVEYSFTDISPTLVKNASGKFKAHSDWMRFLPFDMEKPVPADLCGKYDIVIGTMVVHATSNRVSSCTRLYELLDNGGFLMLSEGTEIIDWYDAAFGLLEGWWLSGDYALQPAETWMRDFAAAGFTRTGYSKSAMRESSTQRLLVGVKDGAL